MIRPDDRDVLERKLADIIDSYDRIRARDGEDLDMRRMRDELIGAMARLDAEVP